MLYYKVPVQEDQRPCYTVKRGRVQHNGYYLIANELLTPGECKRINAPIMKLQEVNISQRKTYKFFGARFEMMGGQEN